MRKARFFTDILIILFLFTGKLYAEDFVVPVVKSPSETDCIEWDSSGKTFSYRVNGTVFKRNSSDMTLLESYEKSDIILKSDAAPALPEGVKTYTSVPKILTTKENNILIVDTARTAGLYNSQGQKIRTFTNSNIISGFTISPDEETLVLYDLKNTLHFYNMKTGSYIGYSPKFGTRKIKDVIINIDSSKLLVSTSDNSIYLVKTRDVIYSPETIAPSIKQFTVYYNTEDPNESTNGGIVEFNVREIRDNQDNNKTEYITTTVEDEKDDLKFTIEEKPKKEEVKIINQPEQEYFPPTIIESPTEKEEISSAIPEESIVTEYKIKEQTSKPPVIIKENDVKIEPEPTPPKIPEVKMVTNTVTIEAPQEDKTVQETVPIVINSTIDTTTLDTQTQQAIDVAKKISEQTATTNTQVPQIIIIQQQPVEPKTEYVYIEKPVEIETEKIIEIEKKINSEDTAKPDKKKKDKEKKSEIIPVEDKTKPIIKDEIEDVSREIITTEEIIVPDEKEEDIEEEIAEKPVEEPTKEIENTVEKITETKEIINNIVEKTVIEKEPILIQDEEQIINSDISSLTTKKKLTEEDKKKLFKDGHGLVVSFDITKLQNPYDLEIDFNLGYKNYNKIRPLYFGGIIKPFIALPSANFPYTYKTETDTLKNPYLIGVKLLCPIGFCYYPLKNSFEVYAEGTAGITLNCIWNGNLPPDNIISKPYVSINIGGKIGFCWDFFNFSANIQYDTITGISYGATAGVIINFGGSRVIGGTTFK